MKKLRTMLVLAVLTLTWHLHSQTLANKLTPAQKAARQAQLQTNVALIMPPPISQAALKRIQARRAALTLASPLNGGLSAMDSPQTPVGQNYAITDLGDLGGGSSYAYGINNNSEVVGSSAVNGGKQHAFFWSSGSTMKDMGTLSGGTYSSAISINMSEQIVGYSATSADTPYNALYHATLWQDKDSSPQDLGTLGGSGSSEANSINASGQIVGWAVNGFTEAFLWQPGGPMQNLTGGDYYGSGNDINDNSWIVGVLVGPTYYWSSFLWINGSLQGINTTVNGSAEAINNKNDIVGVNGNGHAFLLVDGQLPTSWPQDLGTLGGSRSVAYGINSSDQVVGQSDTSSSGTHAFLYSGGVLQDLNSLVVNPDPSWTLQTATGINDAGQIVGYGINSSGQYHAFLLNPLPLGSVQAASTVQTSLPTYGAIPAPEGDQDSLIVVTHGWINPGWPSYENPQVTIDSVNSMSNSIQQYLIANNLLNKWKVYGYMWQDEASLTLLQGGPSRAIHNAHQQGNIVGESIVQDGWKHVHFIGHSAGAGLIQSATEEIKATSTLSPPVVIHETFLDAYDGAALEFVSEYGYKADWADSYFSRDLETGEATQQPLLWAYNADVTTLDPNASQEKVPGFVSGGDLNSPCYKTESTHGWPIDFYDNTITGNVNINYGMFGFPLSEEMGVSLSSLASQYVVGNGFSGGGSVEILGPPDPTCSLAGVITPSYMNTGTSFPASSTIQSTTGTIQEFLNSLKLITGSPVWVATVITDTNALNTLSFDAEFTSASGADGLLSVYWDTNMIGLVDEAAVQSGLQHYTLPFPNSATNTSHILGFHMDPFTSVHSSITITNIAMGFVGVQPPVLSVTTNKSNGLFVYQLTGQPDSYTIQANSDLTTTNWVNIALLGNTTGAVNFVDQNSTNYPIRFYRAVGQ